MGRECCFFAGNPYNDDSRCPWVSGHILWKLARTENMHYATKRRTDRQTGGNSPGEITAAGVITLKEERGVVVTGIKTAIIADIKAEEALEKDAEKLLDQTLSAMGGHAASTATGCCG